MYRLQAGLAVHGAAFFAHHQTGGKGQRGKSWLDEPGNNIALSVIIDCSFLSPGRQFPLSIMVALAGRDLFSKYAGDETFVKWPNDIYWRDRKAGGILIENLVRGSIWQASVVGIGMNVNQINFPKSLKNPVSLKQVTGKHVNPVQLAKELCESLEKRYTQLKTGDFNAMFEEYNSHLFKRGELVKLKLGARSFECKIKGVSVDGELEVIGAEKDCFRFEEVEWVIPAIISHP
jgi:BirA family biotin operon repressor/biotin-[acetyl-CoA-carboxylase] ligase